MSELADFLLRRIEEEERAAWAAPRRRNASELLSPGRLLVDCATRRKIIALHEVHVVSDGTPAMLDGESGSCRAGQNERDYVCPTLRLLALRYVDHVEFRTEWQVPNELSTLVSG
jgi:Family of unknown function (DUF6221)